MAWLIPFLFEVNMERKNDTQIFDGYWFLPTNPTIKIAGQLTIDTDAQIILKLYDAFEGTHKVWHKYLEEDPIIETIWGITFDNKKITVFNCRGRISIHSNIDFCIMRYVCDMAITGKHISNLDEPGNYKVKAENRILRYWCYPSALETTIISPSKEHFTIGEILFNFSEVYKDNNIQTVHISETESISLKRDISYNSSLHHFDHHICQNTYLWIEPNFHTLNRILDIIRLFERFITLATLRDIGHFKVTLYDLDNYQEFKDGAKLYNQVDVIINKENTEDRSDINNLYFLFTYELIKENYDDIIKNWYNCDKNILQIRGHLIDSILPSKYFSSKEFLSVAQAIDGFWQRFREKQFKINNPNQKGRISYITGVEQLFKEFHNVEYISIKQDELDAIKDSRDYFSHLLEIGKKPNAKDGFELYQLYYSLRKLLICCVLSFLGLDNTLINELFHKSNNRMLKKVCDN